MIKSKRLVGRRVQIEQKYLDDEYAVAYEGQIGTVTRECDDMVLVEIVTDRWVSRDDVKLA